MAAPAPAGVAALPVAPRWLADFHHPVQRVAALIAIVLIFLRFSMVPEVLTAILGLPSFLYYMLLPLGFVCTAMTGGLGRVFEEKAARWWMLFGFWIFVTTPFSTWRGGSVELLLNFIKGAGLMLLITGGALLSWKQARQAVLMVALGGSMMLFWGNLFDEQRGGRVSLTFGTIGNSNDLAAHWLLTLPALFYVLGSKRSMMIFRLAVPALLVVGLSLILSTGSRGALVAMGVATIFYAMFGPGRMRVIVLPIVLAGLAVGFALAPSSAVSRLSSMFESQTTTIEGKEAGESQRHREMMIRNGLIFIRDNPLFGVGPAQFSGANGQYEKESGERTYWMNAHNSYLMAGAEMGLPGLIFFLGAIWMTGRTLWNAYRLAQAYPGHATLQEIKLASLSLLLGFVAFSVAIVFLNFTYLFHAPTFTGIALGLSRAARWEAEKARSAVRS
jgi:O-antigen ligase